MRPITLTDDTIVTIMEKLKTQLSETRTVKDKVVLTYDMAKQTLETPVLVNFTEKAWLKMYELIKQCDKEVAWHGTVSKDSAKVYTIHDVYVFPQQVTGATVTTEDEEYAEWLLTQPDDVFNTIRFHGHSHVNMGTSPSGVDLTYQNAIIQGIEDFYIFAIMNKKGEVNLTIYDIVDNAIYEGKDVEYNTPYFDTEEWATNQLKQFVRTTAAVINTNPAPTNWGRYAEDYDGYDYWGSKERITAPEKEKKKPGRPKKDKATVIKTPHKYYRSFMEYLKDYPEATLKEYRDYEVSLRKEREKVTK